MADTLSIVLAQLTQSVGDLRANADAILAVRGRHPAADLICYPEMQLVGYPPEDLVLKPALIARAKTELDRLADATADGGPAMLVGTIHAQDGLLYNVLALLDGGRVAAITRKHELPNYGTFDEKRLFASGPLPDVVEFRGVRLGLPICEDIWFPAVCGHLAAQGAELLIAPHGSPYEIDKDDRRLMQVAGGRVAETGLPLIFLNRVGGQDELVFDGCSFVLDAAGNPRHKLVDWAEEERVTQWRRGSAGGWDCDPGTLAVWEDHPADIYSAMVLALRDYVERNRFPGVVLGMSGGIDSAICAAIAADALGPERVWCVMLPSRFTSQSSLDDAAALCSDDDRSAPRQHPDRAGGGRLRHHARGQFCRCRRRHYRRECPVAHPRCHADGAFQQIRSDAADHRQQERDERRLCHHLWRHGGRL